jgi:pyruvate formate lyase activating enzyme
MSGSIGLTQRRKDAGQLRNAKTQRRQSAATKSTSALTAVSAAERHELEQTQGVVFNVQRMSMHDGPGVRTNVFLKGCPLRCGWCANPESQQMQPELMLRAGQCIDCGQFAEPCAACWPAWQAAQRRNTIQLEEIDARIHLCPTGALNWVGEWRAAGDVMAQVRRDQPFYGDGGGLTLTGGEPTMQPAFCVALLHLAKDAGIATAMETCGHTQWEVFAELLPWLDVLLFDVKQLDPVRHLEHTGLDNALILENLRRSVAAGATVRVRVPLIPGFNATPEDVTALVEYVQSLPGPVQAIDLLPYHTLGKAKYAALGRAYPWQEQPRLSSQQVEQLAAIVAGCGIPVTIGG